MTILLNTLIVCHLEVIYNDRGSPVSGLWSHALHDAPGNLGYRPGQRVAGHNVDLQFIRLDDNPKDLFTALVGRGLDETSAPQRMYSLGGEGRFGGGPRQLQ
jgi:hypothetical protein